ncbi:hypothetical protein CoNPh35_CDS0033 [Staphylococcus phage S-CoN_Ph35]|nr:hypothetical protein CoNPh35_CDS0033 [Staphylococcus phage S-CoN_Ph35]
MDQIFHQRHYFQNLMMNIIIIKNYEQNIKI